jgi:hypothetical protein
VVFSPVYPVDHRLKHLVTRYCEILSRGEARAGIERFRRELSGMPELIIQALAETGTRFARPPGPEWEPFELFKSARVINRDGTTRDTSCRSSNL